MQRLLKRNLYIIIGVLLILMVAIGFLLSFAGGKEVAQSAVISNADVISTDLLMTDKANRGSSIGGSVFNGNALSELYAKLAGTGADFNAVATKARTAKSTYSNSSVKSMHSGMDSGEIRTANGGKNIVVKLDGKEWIVTALTTKDTSSSSDVVLTLMLKDIAYNSKWGNWVPSSSTNFGATYPATMYSTSYIRAGLLGNGTQYTTDGSALTAYTGASQFGIYTDSTETGNITNFIVKPNEVLYQQYENLFDIAQGKQSGTWYNAPNDSSKYDIASSKWYTNGVIAMQSKNGYYNWGNDLIWLPSLSETGQNARSGVNADGGLWNLDAGQRGVSAGQLSWLRSGSTVSV